MRVLLVHPDDTPLRRECTGSRWDLIVDLGFAGASVYEGWSRQAGCRVLTLHQFGGQESYRWVKQGLALGRGRLLDRLGLDWWEILAPCAYQEHQALYLVEQLRREIGPGPVELVVTRAHSHAQLLSLVTGCPVRALIAERSTARRFVSRVVAAAQNLRPSQMVEIAFDKWDPSFRLRSWVAKRRWVRSKEPVVLLPSAYSNVTRTQLAYAAQLQERRFLLATTRRSGESADLPTNVVSVPLSAYAETSADTKEETADLLKGWSALKTELGQVEELRHGLQARLWDYFTRDLETGLRLRDAWRVLMSTEPVSGVLCGDDLNYHTRLPLILAGSVGARAVYCSHGALDGGLLFKKSYADLSLVKGEMERDYMLQVSEVEPERIEIAAPAERPHIEQTGSSNRDRLGGEIVLFSQPYEVSGGRTREIYREILGPLLRVAQQLNRRIILKLHPFESRRGRARLLRSVLSTEELERVGVCVAPAPEVLRRTFLGIGLDSSVAVECAQRGIPYFLCGWLDFSGFGYLRQFARFGVGTVLETPSEILSIPRRVSEFKPDRSTVQRLWQPADDLRLDQLLFGTSGVLTANKCAC
jgi:hypothetical protein